MTDEQIHEKVRNSKCPDYFFCTVATTDYPEERRVEICTDCWKDYLKESSRGIDTPL